MSDSLREAPRFCPGCGVVLEEHTRTIQTLRENLALAEEELRGKRARIKRLKADQDQRVRDSEHYEAACEVAYHWQAVCRPSASEPLNAKRLEPTIARLAHYSKADLKRAIDGYAARPFIVNRRRVAHGPKDHWYADLELIMRDAKHVDAGLMMAEMEGSFEGVVKHVEPSREEEAAEVSAQMSMVVSGQEDPLSIFGVQALAYVDYGWQVFPVLPGEKRPLPNGNGLLDATHDKARIERFWRRSPTCNLAIRCGRESRLVVLDVDDRHGGLESLAEIERTRGALPETLSVVTPGGGTHYYFQHPGPEIPNSSSEIGPGLDIRGDGGYVVAPPSTNGNGRRYEFDQRAKPAPMPEWLVREIVRKRERLTAALAQLRWDVVFDGVAPGARNDRMTSVVGALVARGHGTGEVVNLADAVNKQHCRPPLSDKELQAIINSVLKMDARKAS